ncbi:formyltetrahydrofolate deformylase [Anseongella ginsenosidimutans]|uniref:Formyltetrahydrofolate deformylase n=1 Tax=Anseongella ginsenosidimutans TaxID=496056 RepID=A0A4R3KSR6_9SPHI|nr:formyltetrahydrofolate deformylase [Anseongella ginsenosidimutans]QEC53380.1 formyltetrahydrofolate deformylase [Anseongella ginsenosidimutans]TCS88266.1 formyltetrahydrofolate deformylase [Anseongella ginsenosidimutans]
MDHKTLILVQCRDAVGLVSKIAHVLAACNMNITAMREFVDEGEQQFFARIACAGIDAPDENKLLRELEEALPQGANVLVNPRPEKKVAVLVTREYHCLGDILTRHFFQTLGATVCCVIGNHDHLRAFTEQFSIPFHYISHEGQNQEEFEASILETLGQYEPDYLVLAKFMRILSPEFVAGYRERIINIHHSFLPAFMGAHPYRRAFERGVKLIGATAHFVTTDLDQGPIIAQQTTPVNHNFSVKDMVVAGKGIEKAVLNRALQLVFQDRVFVSGNKTVVFE